MAENGVAGMKSQTGMRPAKPCFTHPHADTTCCVAGGAW